MAWATLHAATLAVPLTFPVAPHRGLRNRREHLADELLVRGRRLVLVAGRRELLPLPVLRQLRPARHHPRRRSDVGLEAGVELQARQLPRELLRLRRHRWLGPRRAELAANRDRNRRHIGHRGALLQVSPNALAAVRPGAAASRKAWCFGEHEPAVYGASAAAQRTAAPAKEEREAATPPELVEMAGDLPIPPAPSVFTTWSGPLVFSSSVLLLLTALLFTVSKLRRRSLDEARRGRRPFPRRRHSARRGSALPPSPKPCLPRQLPPCSPEF